MKNWGLKMLTVLVLLGFSPGCVERKHIYEKDYGIWKELANGSSVRITDEKESVSNVIVSPTQEFVVYSKLDGSHIFYSPAGEMDEPNYAVVVRNVESRKIIKIFSPSCTPGGTNMYPTEWVDDHTFIFSAATVYDVQEKYQVDLASNSIVAVPPYRDLYEPCKDEKR